MNRLASSTRQETKQPLLSSAVAKAWSRSAGTVPAAALRAWPLALICLLLARLALGFVYSAANPLGEAPDEADHYAYAAYIGREHRLPDGTWMTQAKHPPLYHTLAAALAGWTGMDASFLRSNPDVGLGADAAAPNFFVHTAGETWPWRSGALAMHLGRLVSMFAGLALVAVTYALAHAVWPDWPGVGLAAAAFVAFLPESLFIGGSMSNDMLAALLAALALWAGLRALTWPRALLAGLCLGLAFITKVSTVSLWPVVLLAMLSARDDGRPEMSSAANTSPTADAGKPTGERSGAGTGAARALEGRLARSALAGGMALVVAAPWLWRNWRLFGDPLGMQMVLATVDRRQAPLNLGWLARGWFASFFGRFGGAGQIPLPTPFYVLWGLLLVLALAGWLLWTVRAVRRQSGLLHATGRAGLIVLLGAPVLTALSIFSYSQVALGTDQGRLLFPALAPIALLLAGGIAALLPRRHGGWLAGGMAGAMGTLAVLALVLGILQPFAAPPPPAAQELDNATRVDAVFGGALDLVALRWENPELANAALAPLTLYWSATHGLSDDLRSSLRLLNSAGDLLWEWKRSPGAGRFSTDRWPPGRLVADTYRIPSEVLAQAARIEVGVYPFPDEEWLRVTGDGEGDQWLALPLRAR